MSKTSFLASAVLLLLFTTLSGPGCDREKKDKIDELPRGTGGSPATQTTRPAP